MQKGGKWNREALMEKENGGWPMTDVLFQPPPTSQCTLTTRALHTRTCSCLRKSQAATGATPIAASPT
jgi:hypothetical protein